MPFKNFDLIGIGRVKICKRRGNRMLRLSIEFDGTVRVSIPPWMPYRAGIAFALSKRNWLESFYQASPRLIANTKVGKSHHLVFGCDPELEKVRTHVGQVEIRVDYPSSMDSNHEEVQSAAKAACRRALRRQAEQLLPQRLGYLAKSHDLTYNSLNVKLLKRRWGSCDQKRNIVLNLYLIQLPWNCIDYVILHELAHTKVLHHGSPFWSFLETLQPGAQHIRKDMRQYQPSLLIA